MKEKLIYCPVCRRRFWSHALSKHVSQMAGKEAQYQMCMLINTSKMRPRTFSPTILLKNAKHWSYYRKQKLKTIKNVYDL